MGWIYTVSTFKLTGKSEQRWRTWGWFHEFEPAEHSVLNNKTNMFEDGYYDRAVIEKVPSGIIPICTEQWWYRAWWSNEDSQQPEIIKTMKPEELKNVVNFSMG